MHLSFFLLAASEMLAAIISSKYLTFSLILLSYYFYLYRNKYTKIFFISLYLFIYLFIQKIF
jgi:hypothetical protein